VATKLLALPETESDINSVRIGIGNAAGKVEMLKYEASGTENRVSGSLAALKYYR
jgi:hypothetical protein